MSEIDPIKERQEEIPVAAGKNETQFTGSWPQRENGGAELHVEAEAWPGVVYGRELRAVLARQGICEADLVDPDLDERYVSPLVVEPLGFTTDDGRIHWSECGPIDSAIDSAVAVREG